MLIKSNKVDIAKVPSNFYLLINGTKIMSKPLENLDELLKSHKLTQEDYEHIIKILGRDPNLVELGIFSAMWSEHCSYKSSKIYLNGFPT